MDIHNRFVHWHSVWDENRGEVYIPLATIIRKELPTSRPDKRRYAYLVRVRVRFAATYSEAQQSRVDITPLTTDGFDVPRWADGHAESMEKVIRRGLTDVFVRGIKLRASYPPDDMGRAGLWASIASSMAGIVPCLYMAARDGRIQEQ